MELIHSGREAKRGETKQKHNYIVYARVVSDGGGAQRRQCPSLRRGIRAKTCGGGGWAWDYLGKFQAEGRALKGAFAWQIPGAAKRPRGGGGRRRPSRPSGLQPWGLTPGCFEQSAMIRMVVLSRS